MACCLIYVGVLFDCLDGLLARRLNAVTEMGRQLDSFADLITFGIAPIVIFITHTPSISPIAMLVLLVYPLAGCYRLVRHNLQGQCEYFTGLPITAAGLILATTLLINTYVQSEFSQAFIVLYLHLTLILAIMMVSNVRVNRLMCRRCISKDAAA